MADVDFSDLLRDLAAESAPAIAPTPGYVDEPQRAPPATPPLGPKALAPANPVVVARIPGLIAPPPASPPSPPADVFVALDDRGPLIPADTNGAVGENALLVAINNEMAIQKRDGALVGRVALRAFWAKVDKPKAPAPFDPKVLYDRFAKRWVFVACADQRAKTSSLLVGVSKTDNPAAGWNTHRFDVDPKDEMWLDYPSVGLNRKWIVVQGNMFGISSDANSRSDIYVFNKTDLYAGGPGKHKRLSLPGAANTLAPEVNGDNSDSMVLVGAVNANPCDSLQLYRITGTEDAPDVKPLDPLITVPDAQAWSTNPPKYADFAPQKGAAEKLNTDDSRILGAVSHKGKLWCVHTVFLPAIGALTRSAVQYWQINPDATDPADRVTQFGRLDDSQGRLFRAFPSVAVNCCGDVLIGYSRFEGNNFAGAAYAYRQADDPVNTFRQEVVFKPGLAKYVMTNKWPKNRWGDYSNTVIDPDGHGFWTIQKFALEPSVTAGETTDRFGTVWAHVTPP
jgi:hypothetical protein